MPKRFGPLIFFGSGPLAAASLAKLIDKAVIEAVITKPGPQHHANQMPVLKVAGANQIPIYTPNSKRELSHLFNSQRFKSEVGLVIDYGFIIEQSVIESFPKGIVNSHFSILPQWRGPDPISFAILSGQVQTGVSIMLINDKIDEGLLLAQEPVSIRPRTTSPELSSLLIETSTKLLSHSLPRYLNGQLSPYPQDLTQTVTYSRKLTKEDGRLDFSKPATVLEREIRAFIEWPKSYTTIGNRLVIITAVRLSAENGRPGSVKVEPKNIKLYCNAGALIIDRLKPAGKPEMSSGAYLAGYKHQARNA